MRWYQRLQCWMFLRKDMPETAIMSMCILINRGKQGMMRKFMQQPIGFVFLMIRISCWGQRHIWNFVSVPWIHHRSTERQNWIITNRSIRIRCRRKAALQISGAMIRRSSMWKTLACVLPKRISRCWSQEKQVPGRKLSPNPFIWKAAAVQSLLWPLIAGLYRQNCWNRNSLAMRVDHLPEPKDKGKSANLRWPIKEPSFWMRLAICRCICRSSFWGFCRNMRLNVSAEIGRYRLMWGSYQQPVWIWWRWCRKEPSEKICIIVLRLWIFRRYP